MDECQCRKPIKRAGSLPSLPEPEPMTGPQYDALVVATARSFLPQSSANSALALRAKNKSQRVLLERSSSFGELNGLRSGVMSASMVLGPEDPHVKRLVKATTKAESFRRFCRNTYLELEPRILRRSMGAVLGQLYFVERELGLGGGLWEDLFLSWARAAAAAWQEHQSFFDQAAAQLEIGPAAYCEFWVRFALESAEPLIVGFGPALTNQLLQLPDAGLELVRAMCRVFSELPATPSSGGPACDAPLQQIKCLARLLGGLESQKLEHMLLREGTTGQTSFDLAADQHDLRAFCVLILVLHGEVLTITADLQVALSGTSSKVPPSLEMHLVATELPLSRCGQRLCQLLNLSPEHINELELRILQSGGFQVRLQPLLGHPTAQQALKAIEIFENRGDKVDMCATGVFAEPRKPIQRLDPWQSAIKTASLVFDFPARCRAAQLAWDEAIAYATQCEVQLEQCVQHTAELAGLISETTTKRDDAKEMEKAEETEYMEMIKKEMALSKKAMSGDDQAEVDLDTHKASMKTKKADLASTREALASLEQKSEQLSSEHSEASSAEATARANLEVAQTEAADAAVTSKDIASKYETVLHTPVAPSIPYVARASLRQTRKSCRSSFFKGKQGSS